MIMPDNQLLCTATIKNKSSTSIQTDPMTCFFRTELKNGVKLLNCVDDEYNYFCPLFISMVLLMSKID